MIDLYGALMRPKVVKIFVFVAILCLFCGGAIAAEPISLDFGSVPLKGVRVREVVLRAGEKPLVVSRVDISCPCTKVEWSKKPVAAGDSIILKVTYKGLDKGAFYKTVNLTTSQGEAQPPRIILRGRVE